MALPSDDDRRVPALRQHDDWLALSDWADRAPDTPGLLPQGLFILELRLPIQDPTVLLQVQSPDGTRAFSVFFDPIGGMSLLQRDGTQIRRHLLPGPLPQRQGVARLTFGFDVTRRTWELSFDLPGEASHRSIQGTDPLPLHTADIHALSTDAPGAKRHPATLWFGLTHRTTGLPDRAPWIGLNTPIDTKRGPVRAGLLRPGDLIATVDDGFQPLLATRRRTFPSRGTFAPVVLRSPFFGLNGDILVSSDQLVLISGASVEYLYGEEEALISAASLCDGHVAAKDERRAVTDCVALDLGAPFLITADGCCLMSACTTFQDLPRRALRDCEALPLLALLGRTALRHVA